MRAPPGRSSDLEACLSVLEPPFGVAVLTGEPRSGATELAAAWRAAAAAKGFLCGGVRVGGVADAHPLTPLFASLLDAVESYEARAEIERMWRAIPAPGTIEFPLVQRYLRSVEAPGQRPLPFPWEVAQLDRLRALEAGVALFRTVASTRPLALAIQAVQWASPLFHEYLGHLIVLAAEVPFTLLVTRETEGGAEDEARPGDEAMRALSEATRRAGSRFVDVELAPLADISLEEVISTRYPHAQLPEGEVRKLLYLAQGNPGRLADLLRRLEEAGILRNQGGAWTLDAEASWPFPESVEEFRLSPVLELEVEDFDLLEFWAGAGGLIPDALVASPEATAYHGVAERRARKALSRMSEAGVVESVPGGWSIRDPALVRALRDEADTAVRVRDLEIVAGSLMAEGVQDPTRAARLYQEAGQLARAASSLRSAAQRLEKVGAFSSAAEAYTRARGLASEAGVEEGLEARIDLHRFEGNAWQVAGKPEEATQSYASALVPAELLDLHGRIAGLRCRRGSCQLDLGDAEAAADDFEQALEAAQAAGSRPVTRLACLGLARARRRSGDPQGALQACDQAGQVADPVQPWLDFERARAEFGVGQVEEAERRLLHLAEATGSVGLLPARVLAVLSELYRSTERPQEARQIAGAAVNRARDRGDPLAVCASLEVLAEAAAATDDHETSHSAWVELFGLAARTGRRETQLVAAFRAGEGCLNRRQNEAAAHLLQRAVTLARAAGERGLEARGQALLGTANLGLNKLYEAQADFEEAGRLAQQHDDPAGYAESLLGLGRVYAAQRKRERAREMLTEAADAFRAIAMGARADAADALLRTLM